MYELETWHYDAGKRWTTKNKYNCLTDLEYQLLLYKLSDNLGYKIYHNKQMIKQWFDKQSYRGIYNDTTTDT